ncbi:hypothetical protein [Campylobacter sp. 19-13652]|uniref:hypothetical protein n=1 Tax=Campylobacter sp. 19-13652 TaxID=2840180 RepID=UPI001C744860|nr:hypothetical protein [Campylobacter sp. 19-13652]BCX78575.1 hypothetical protein LBC_00370 [Campylobacter sp. 19-13652]
MGTLRVLYGLLVGALFAVCGWIASNFDTASSIKLIAANLGLCLLCVGIIFVFFGLERHYKSL